MEMEIANRWEWVLQLAIIVSSLLAGRGAVHLVNWLKELLGLEGKNALYLAAGVSFIAALAIAVTEGVISADMTPEKIGVIFVTVMGTAHLLYKNWFTNSSTN